MSAATEPCACPACGCVWRQGSQPLERGASTNEPQYCRAIFVHEDDNGDNGRKTSWRRCTENAGHDGPHAAPNPWLPLLDVVAGVTGREAAMSQLERELMAAADVFGALSIRAAELLAEGNGAALVALVEEFDAEEVTRTAALVILRVVRALNDDDAVFYLAGQLQAAGRGAEVAVNAKRERLEELAGIDAEFDEDKGPSH